MARFSDAISDDHAAFMAAQPVFFVATATAEGRINLSPKGLDGTFRVLGPNRVAFLNLTGSGNETAAHLRIDDRITLMFCAFSGAPKILRLYGRGRAVHAGDAGWADLVGLFADLPGKRQVMVVEVDSVNSSCGFGVPLMEPRGQRTMLPDWAGGKGPAGIRRYWRDRNATSFDGLPTGIPVDPSAD
ncbi:MAG: pyridoxamine 5'-phosphate oxidase family protein [Pseudomonadota bacterium]